MPKLQQRRCAVKKLMRCVLIVSAVALLAGPAMAETKIGLGYQGVLPADILSGVSVRGWVNGIGLDVNLFQAAGDLAGTDADALLLEGRAMLTAFSTEQSKFYIGGLFGFGTMDALGTDVDLLTFGGFFGTEFSLTGLPELGFSWEVGYDFVIADAAGADIDANGILVLFGVHYYPEMFNM
jgi:hypothetical protein